jgi:aryl-alcohol dehydrogenase-like predicted oxidoreductase
MFARQPGGITAGAIRFALEPREVSTLLSGASRPEETEQAVAEAATPLPPELGEAVRTLARGEALFIGERRPARTVAADHAPRPQ